MQLISLGSTCLPKFGFEDHLRKQPTLFYDWLITDILALKRSLLCFDENKFLTQGCELCDGGIRVLDLHAGLRFQHEFSVPNGATNGEFISLDFHRVRETYLRRRSRMFDMAAKAETLVFVRYESVLDANNIYDVYVLPL